MPTYDYHCDKCGHTFEEFQSISATHLKKCPKCSGKIKRLIGGGSGVLFKGTGFYQTDYRSDSYSAAVKKDLGKQSPPDTKPASNSSSEKSSKNSNTKKKND